MGGWSQAERFWALVAIVTSLISAAWVFFIATQANIIWEEAHFLLAGRTPDWGYPDTPAGSPLFVALSERLFGDSRIGIRALTWFVASLLPAAVYFLASPVVSRRHALMAAALAAILPPFIAGKATLIPRPHFRS